jgi:S-(hydroxymethyl)glutathione dehydrogenase / alcohol dehydrogenase
LSHQTTSRAALIREFGKPYVIEEVLLDAPRGREVLVQVKGSGLCHSDQNFAHNDFGLPLPIVLGHEAAGVVIGLGPDVTEVALGDHVVACALPSCGRCDECLQGYRVNCLHPEVAVRGADEPPRITAGGEPVTQFVGIGGFADHILVHESQLVPIDASVPLDRASLVGCGVVTGGGAVLRSAAVKPGDTVVVIGAGGVGLNAIQTAALVGARKVIAVDLQEDKLALAKRFGATHVVNPTDGDPVAEVMELTGGLGVHHAFEVTGAAVPLKQAAAMLGRRGKVYVIGMQKPGTVLDWAVDPYTSTHATFEQGVLGVNMGSTNFKIDVPYFAELYMQNRYNLDDLVSKTIGLDEINEGYEVLNQGGVARSVITFQS